MTLSNCTESNSTLTNKIISNSTVTSKEVSPLAQFQHNFGQYLREQRPSVDSQNVSLQDASTISSRIGNLYQDLIFNNVRGFLDKCFPVCQSLISDEQWLHVCKQFFLQHACHSPYFTEINQHFVDYLAMPNVLQNLNLPPYFAELADYEWVELKVDTGCTDDDFEEALGTKPTQDSMSDIGYLGVNPTLQNLHYQWPVHLISTKFKPSTTEDSFYLVYRDASDHVQFMQVNALTYALIDFIHSQPAIPSSENGLTQLMQGFANHLGYEDVQVLISFGLPLLQQLIEKQVLYIKS